MIDCRAGLPLSMAASPSRSQKPLEALHLLQARATLYSPAAIRLLLTIMSSLDPLSLRYRVDARLSKLIQELTSIAVDYKYCRYSINIMLKDRSCDKDGLKANFVFT